MTNGCVIWLTGLPSSGKTTIAENLAQLLRQTDLPVEVLDGDEVRRTISADLGFSAKDRREHAIRVIFLSKLLIRNGINVIVPLISPYEETRQFARSELQPFFEVYVNCTLEECVRRDVKGLYAKALKGEIKEFTGVSDPYEPPKNPEITVETHVESLDQCCRRILSVISGQVPHMRLPYSATP
jgi:adenylylsulfate kinase